MTNTQLAQASDESIETTREVLKTSLASNEKLTKLNLDASKKFLEETTRALKEMTGITNPKELFDKVNKLATNTVENNISSCRDVCGIITDTQNKISKMFESQIHNAQKNIASATEKLSKINPAAKSNFGADAMQRWINSTNQAMDTLNKMAAQVSEFTNKNLKSATNATNSTAKKAAKR
ncbi:MAG TPA: phasin family protein [Aquella sp.]|nr:phasin family protein [Aquella sp.]